MAEKCPSQKKKEKGSAQNEKNIQVWAKSISTSWDGGSGGIVSAVRSGVERGGGALMVFSKQTIKIHLT